MRKFLVTCTKIYNGTMFVDAENNEEALDIAQNNLNENVDCINWDFGEATADIADEDEEVILDGDGEEESHLSPDYKPLYNIGEYIIEANYKDISDKRIVFFKIDDIRNGKYICSDGKEDDLDYLDTDVDLRLAEPTEITKYFEAHHKYNVGDFVGSIDCPPDKVVDISYDAYYFASGDAAYILALDNNADFYLIQPKYNVGDFIVSECGTVYKVISAEHGSYIAENKYGDERCHFDNDNGVFNFRLATPDEVNVYKNQTHPRYKVGDYVKSDNSPADKIVSVNSETYFFESGEQSDIIVLDDDATFYLVQPPKYNVGDYIRQTDHDVSDMFRILEIRDGKYICSDGKEDEIPFFDYDVEFRKATADEIKQYYQAHHKYNVGDTIGPLSRNGEYEKIIEIENGVYTFESLGAATIESIDNDKDISTKEKEYTFAKTDLLPFDKVLVRDDNRCVWVCAFFSHIDYSSEVKPYVTCGGEVWEQCVPYNNDTALYLGTKQDYNGKYKTW